MMLLNEQGQQEQQQQHETTIQCDIKKKRIRGGGQQ